MTTIRWISAFSDIDKLIVNVFHTVSVKAYKPGKSSRRRLSRILEDASGNSDSMFIAYVWVFDKTLMTRVERKPNNIEIGE